MKYPVKLISSELIGYSKPQRILFSDDLEYVVKFINNPSGTRVLVNEYVASKLAQLLSLPVVPFEIIHISEAFIESNPNLACNKFLAGDQFCSLYIPNCTHLTQKFYPPNQIEITNHNILAGVIVFDHWTSNTDRKENNVLLKPLSSNSYYFYMIDHGRCFSKSNWSIDSLSNLPQMIVNLRVHLWCLSLLKDCSELSGFIDRIVALSNDVIYGVIQSIPENWNVSEQEQEALFIRLVKVKQLLPMLTLQK
ncbi:MAG: HipA family kinase [Paenibacillaceae bacterium]